MDIFGILFGLMINAGLLIVLIFAIPDTVLKYIEYFSRLFRKSRKQKNLQKQKKLQKKQLHRKKLQWKKKQLLKKNQKRQPKKM